MTKTSQDNNLNYIIHFYEYLIEKVQRRNLHHFKAFEMINMQYEIRIW